MSLFQKAVCLDCKRTFPKKELYGAEGSYQCKGCYLSEPVTDLFKIREQIRRSK
jgi:hypothetical protein